jgi:hypothetical protein
MNSATHYFAKGVPVLSLLTIQQACAPCAIAAPRRQPRSGFVLNAAALVAMLAFTLCAQTIAAAPFHAAPVRDGELAIKLHPTEGLGTSVSRVVTFGMPFPRGSVLPAEINRIRVLNSQRQEIPAFVESQTPWRHATDASKNNTSVRIARIQINHVPSVSHPNFDTIYVEWGRNNRALNQTFVNPRNSWHQVTSGSFVSADNVYEPDVFAVLPAQWLSRGVLRVGQMHAFDPIVTEARDSPAVMDATEHYPDYQEQQYASKNFFYTAINEFGSDTPSTVLNPYRTVDEPWLYDRASTFYSLYLRSGFFKPLREAVRNAEFYRLQLYPAGTVPSSAIGAFRLKVPSPSNYIGANGIMYSYNEPLAYSYWLTGDNEMVEPIKWVTKGQEDATDEVTRWTPTAGYTERHIAFRLISHVIAFEVFGDTATILGKTTTYKQRFQDIMTDLRWHQDGAGGAIPAARVDGGLWKYGQQQGEGADNTFVAAAWHYGQLIDAVVRVYAVTEDPNVAQFIRRTGTFLKAASKLQPSEFDAFGGQLREIDYVTNIDGSTYAPDGAFYQHVLQVAGAMGWSYYFSAQLGAPDATLKNHANDLYLTYDYFVNDRTRPTAPAAGQSAFRIGNTDPWRLYNWMYHNSGSLSWTLSTQLVSTACRIDANGDQSLDVDIDGVLILRYLLGLRGDTLTAGLTLTGNRTSGDAIGSFLNAQNLDVRGLSPASPAISTRDGIVILRHLQKQSPTAMVAGTDIGSANATAINDRIVGWCAP